MREEVLKAALAGLLHDVGKLGMLAGETARGSYVHAEVGQNSSQVGDRTGKEGIPPPKTTAVPRIPPWPGSWTTSLGLLANPARIGFDITGHFQKIVGPFPTDLS